jgi:ubiquinone/menaquinone biosynthesis C-methylase UbiE
MTEPDQYLLGYRQAEQQRLQEQAQQLAHESDWLFDRIGVGAGARVVEIGCGPEGCLRLLSARVGRDGSVVGVERSDDAVALAQTMIRDRTLTNVEVMQGDARSTGLPRSSFDFATSRLVLVNVPDPAEIVEEAVAMTKPGGTVAFHEADYIAHVCDPPIEEWSRAVELLDAYSRSNGVDLFMGRKVPRMLRAAGLVDVQVNPLVHVYPEGHGRRPILLDFVENLSGRLVDGNFVEEGELELIKSGLVTHLSDPETLVVSHLFIQAWGRKV